LKLFPGSPVRYVGREPSASPATGSSSIHREQQAELVREALEVPSE
jgi:2-oxoglutarate dehydrogenase complex dehydrogenase (E1) component-like enzyme